MKLPIQAEELLPHQGKMLLINTLLTADDGTGTAISIPDNKSLSIGPDGKILDPFYIELLAQTYAAVCGYGFMSRGLPVPEGYLVGVQKLDIHPDESSSCNREILISVSTVGDFDGFAVVEGKVSRDGKLLAEGKIKLFVPHEEIPEEISALAHATFSGSARL